MVLREPMAPAEESYSLMELRGFTYIKDNLINMVG